MTSMLRSGFGTRSIYFVLVNAGPERMTMASAGIAVQTISRRTFSWNVAAGTPGRARKRSTAIRSSPSATMKKKAVTPTALKNRVRTSRATGVAGWRSHAAAGPARNAPKSAEAASAIQKVRPVGSFISAPGSPRPLLLGVQSQRVGVKLLKVRAAEIAVRGHHVARNPAEHELLERSRIRGPVHPRRAQARRRRVGVR